MISYVMRSELFVSKLYFETPTVHSIQHLLLTLPQSQSQPKRALKGRPCVIFWSLRPPTKLPYLMSCGGEDALIFMKVYCFTLLDVSQALFVHTHTVPKRGLMSQYEWKHLCVWAPRVWKASNVSSALEAWKSSAKIMFVSHCVCQETIGGYLLLNLAPCAWMETNFWVAY